MLLSLWLGFLLAAILIAVSPGPGAAVAMSCGMRYGYAAALRSIFGLESALLIQLAIVAVGLGALLTASALAFDIVKFCGAAYLVWLGIQKWRTAPQELQDAKPPMSSNALFVEGLLVNLANPKAIVVIAALTPQFIDPTRPQWLQFLIIAATMCTVDIVVMSGYALLATRLRHWLHDPKTLKAQNRFFGGVFVGAGLLLASTGR